MEHAPVGVVSAPRYRLNQRVWFRRHSPLRTWRGGVVVQMEHGPWGWDYLVLDERFKRWINEDELAPRL